MTMTTLAVVVGAIIGIMTTTELQRDSFPSRRRRAGRSFPVAVGAAAFGLLLVSCGGSSEPDGADGTAGTGQSDASTSVVQDTAATDATTSDVRGPADAALSDALAGLGTSYEFSSELLTLTGDRVLVAGRRVGDGVAFELEAGDAVVEVISVAGETWVRSIGAQEWTASPGSSSGDPLGSLSAPLDVGWDAEIPNRLHARYSGQTIGLGTDEIVSIAIDLFADVITFRSSTNDISLATTLIRTADLEEVASPA